MLARSDVFRMLHGAIGHWEKYRNRPLESEDARWVTNHVLELLKGRSVFVYSVPRAGGGAQLRVRFGINAEQKVLCAALSSYDERFSAETVGARPPVPDLLFPRQVDWAKALIEYVSPRPDLFLILRVHPREFPNKRETVHSSHARELRTVLAHLPANVAVNWPTDGLSLYDLADITDVFLNAWSSVGKEMALLGLPVVIYSLELPLYPADINHVGVTLESYLRQIDQALSEGWRYETLRQAYRWCAVEYRRMLIDISESYTEPAKAQVGLATRVARRAMRALVPHWQQVRDCRRRQPLRARETISRLVSSGSDSILDLPESTVAVRAVDEERERSILRGEIRHLLQVMYPDVGSGRSESKLHNRLEEFARG